MTESLNDLWRTPTPQPISMDYSLNALASASFAISCGKQAYTIRDFGNMTDGLGDLVRAALALATGASYVDVVFDAEPQRWGLALEPAGLTDDKVRIARLAVRDGGTSLKSDGLSGLPVREWSSPALLDGHVTTDEFARAVQQMATKVRSEFDDSTYREMWGHYGSIEGFPLRGLRALEVALSIPEYRE